MRLPLLAALALIVVASAAPAAADSCLDCHRKLDQPRY